MKRKPVRIPWKEFTLKALRRLAQLIGIRGRTRMKRAALVQALQQQTQRHATAKKTVAVAARALLATPASARPPKREEPPPAAPTPPYIDRGKPIPLTYGRDVLRTLARDPEWLFVYWELTPRRLADLRGTYAEILHRPWHLRVVDAESGPAALVPVFLAACSWYLRVQPQREYRVELGFSDGDAFVPVLVSNPARTPRNAISERVDEEWMVLKRDLVKMLKLSDERELLGPSRVFASAERYREVTEEQLNVLRQQAAQAQRQPSVSSGARPAAPAKKRTGDRA